MTASLDHLATAKRRELGFGVELIEQGFGIAIARRTVKTRSRKYRIKREHLTWLTEGIGALQVLVKSRCKKRRGELGRAT